MENKDHIDTGVRSILKIPKIYSFLQNILGAKYRAKVLVNEYIKPLPGSKILDIGCGPADILETLPEDIDYTGFDMNPKYIENARNRYGERANFFCNKVAEVSPEHKKKYDIVLATSVIHHLNDEEAINLFKIAFYGLKDTGQLITMDNTFIPEQPAVAEFLISRDRGQHVRIPKEYTQLAKKVFPTVTYDIRPDLLRVPYTHIIYTCKKG